MTEISILRKIYIFQGIEKYALIAGLVVALVYAINYNGVEYFSLDPRHIYPVVIVVNYGFTFFSKTKFLAGD